MLLRNLIGNVESHKFDNLVTIKNTLDYIKRLPSSEVNNYCVDSLTHGFNGLMNGSKLAICYIPKNLII